MTNKQARIGETRILRTIAALLIVSAIGCEGADELVAPQRPTPTPTYRISGKVTRNGRDYRTTVTATSAGQTWTAQSGFTGSYRFAGLPAGEFHVSASADYCGTVTRTVTVPPDATVDFRFTVCWRSPDGTKSSEE